MGMFHDRLATLGVGDTIGDTFVTDLTADYDADIAAYGAEQANLVSGADARIQQLTVELAALADENLRLKAVNYDLLTQVPTGEPSGETDPTDNEDDAEEVDIFGDDDDKDN